MAERRLGRGRKAARRRWWWEDGRMSAATARRTWSPPSTAAMRTSEFAIADLLASSCSPPHATAEGRSGEAALRRAGHLDTAVADSPPLGLAPSAGGAGLPKASRRHTLPSPWLTSASSSPTPAATTPSRTVSSRSSTSPLTPAPAPAPAQRRRPSSPCPTPRSRSQRPRRLPPPRRRLPRAMTPGLGPRRRQGDRRGRHSGSSGRGRRCGS